MLQIFGEYSADQRLDGRFDRRRKGGGNGRDGLGAEPDQHGDQLGDLGIGGQRLTWLDAVHHVFGAGAHQHVTDLVDLGKDLLVQVDELVGANAVAANLVESLDEFGPGNGGLLAVNPDHVQRQQTLEGARIVDKSLGVDQRHGLRLLSGPGAHDGRFQAQDVAEVAALLPRAEHLPDVRDVVSAVEHRGDQAQPGQMGVVEQRNAAHPQWRRQ